MFLTFIYCFFFLILSDSLRTVYSLKGKHKLCCVCVITLTKGPKEGEFKDFFTKLKNEPQCIH